MEESEVIMVKEDNLPNWLMIAGRISCSSAPKNKHMKDLLSLNEEKSRQNMMEITTAKPQSLSLHS